MSVSPDGTNLRCDGEGCLAHVPALVALRPSQANACASEGWLFICRAGHSQHFKDLIPSRA